METQISNDILALLQSGSMSQALIRRERLKKWMRDKNLSQADVAAAYGSKVPWVRSVLHMNPNAIHNRDIGEKAARRLETSLKMPERFLDGDDSNTSDQATRATGRQLLPIGAIFAVPQLIRAKQTVKLDADHALPMPVVLLDNANTRPEHAAWVRVDTAELAPALAQGANVIVNTTDTTPSDGKLFALAWRDQIIIRRIHLTPQGFRLSLDANPSAALNMTEAEFRSQVSVAGRIRLVVQNFD